MQRKKRLTKRERKEGTPGSAAHQHAHIHCIACGRHLDPAEFTSAPASAKYLNCEHQSSFPACTECEAQARRLLAEHDRTGKPVAQAQAWH